MDCTNEMTTRLEEGPHGNVIEVTVFTCPLPAQLCANSEPHAPHDWVSPKGQLVHCVGVLEEEDDDAPG